jgi:hypothetical protein
VKAELCLQCDAPKSIKVGNEQPPKQPPDFIIFSAEFSPNAAAVRLLVAVLVAVNVPAHPASQIIASNVSKLSTIL